MTIRKTGYFYRSSILVNGNYDGIAYDDSGLLLFLYKKCTAIYITLDGVPADANANSIAPQVTQPYRIGRFLPRTLKKVRCLELLLLITYFIKNCNALPELFFNHQST